MAQGEPSLGVTVSEEFLAGECKRALASPSSQNAFRQLYLNQWVSQESRWLDMGAWMACSAAAPDLTGRLCYVGLDLASVGDVAAAVALFPPQEEGEPWWVLCKFMCRRTTCLSGDGRTGRRMGCGGSRVADRHQWECDRLCDD